MHFQSTETMSILQASYNMEFAIKEATWEILAMQIYDY